MVFSEIKKYLYIIKGSIISQNFVWHLWIFYTNIFNSKFKYYTKNPFEIPIVINNFNKLTTLRNMIYKLNSLGYYNIFVIDNGSVYPPLLEFYNQPNNFKLIRSENLGHRSVFLSKDITLKNIRKSCFIYTDSDLILNENLPPNFVESMFTVLSKYKQILKVGFAIKINDLNKENPESEKIINWEKKYWENEIEPNKYLASIDTTFSLYRPVLYKASNSIVRFYKGIRIAGDFTCKHEPWYWDFTNLNEEQQYYFSNANNSSSYMNIVKEKMIIK